MNENDAIYDAVFSGDAVVIIKNNGVVV